MATIRVGASVTEISASNGALVRLIRGSKFDLDFQSSRIQSAGREVWIANWKSDSVTEVSAATGALLRVVHGSPEVRWR
jgi:hypothetical protein